MAYFLGQVYPRIRQSRSDVRVCITGSTRGLNLGGLPLDDSVVLTGFVEDIRPEIAGAWVAVVPILSGGGTRIKILEAMALGTPVVSTSKGAEGLDAVHEQHILIADDPAAFADCALRLMRDLLLRKRLATNARQLVEERYDWAQIGSRFARLLERTAAHSRRGGARL